MGAEHSQQRIEADGQVILSANACSAAAAATARRKQRTVLRQNTGSSNGSGLQIDSPRVPSPPLSVCSDLPYVSYTDRPIGENSSPKIRNKSITSATRRQQIGTGAKPKRPQTQISQSNTLVIVKPGAKDIDEGIDPDLARLKTVPQFLPVLRESISSATITRDPEVMERLQSQHLLNICSRLQLHLNLCATHIAGDQNHLIEKTKIVSNSITTLFASFVDMQKTYANYAEYFIKIRGITQQLSRCNSLLNENIESLETINNFLDVEDRLEPFVWRADDNKVREKAEIASRGEREKKLFHTEN